MNQKNKIVIISLLIIGGIMSRLLPHPENFSPIAAIGLFAGAYLSNQFAKFLIPLFTLFISDVILNNTIYASYNSGFTVFYDGFYWVYGSFAAVILVGYLILKKISLLNIVISSGLGSILFFIISNFGVWAGTSMYPKSGIGLAACYTAGLPFLGNAICGDLFYTSIIFGVWEFGFKKLFTTKLITN